MKSVVIRGLAWAFAVAAVVPAQAQVKAGPELDVNTFTTGEQSRPAVAVHRNGDFDVVWTSAAQDGSGSGVFGQRYDALGARRGGEFRVNSSTTGAQAYPSVAALFDGGFVVVWTDDERDGSGYGVFGQRYDAAGARRGAEFQVNTYTTGDQLGYGVSAGPFAFAPQLFPFASDFVVTWTSAGQDGFGQGVFARRFGADGTPRGAEFRVNTHTANDQYAPHVSSDANANFVVVWVSEFQDTSGTGIFGQQFRADGSRFGTEFLANSSVTGDQVAPAVARVRGFDPFAGHFTVAWSHPLGGGQYEVLARYFDSQAHPPANAFVVASPIQGPGWPVVAADPYARFTVLWSSGPVIGDGEVFGRRTSIVAPVGSRFQVNTFTTGEQSRVVAAADAVGNLVATWTSFHDGSAASVQAQRFGGLTPQAAAVDTVASGNSDGNGVWDPCETVDVRPSWFNSSGSVQSFAASVSSAIGPLGAAQIVDGTATYGPLPDGAQAACTDCYALLHPCVVNRAVLHADVFAREDLFSTGQGQAHGRSLHVGDSFTDVPRSNPFYRFVETLLHTGVTGGCGGFQYCPGASVTREQMAAFVLAAKDRAFVPPPCGTPVFGDVPASSPFCRWIEELARRGVTSGCGGGNYCPAAAVSREQMAVFVLRTLDPALDPPACGTPVFNDVPASSPYCRWIEELARRGAVGGCGGGSYCPASPVTREQMGAFLGVAFGLQLYGP